MSLLPANATMALVAAVTWGGGDFSGGMGVKSAGGTLRAALRFVLLSHGASLLFLLLLLLSFHRVPPHGAPLVWGLLAGLFGAVSVLCFYICLATGAMGATAAISGLLAAAIPSLVSSLLEGVPGPVHIAGFCLAGVAIWLIAGGAASAPAAPRAIPLALASGAGFGLYFVALRMAGSGGVFWSLALSRSVSIAVCLTGLGWLTRRSSASATPAAAQSLLRATPAMLGWAALAAALDTAGNLFFIAATRAGRLDVAAVLASLYPASTILLAAWLLRERPGRQQLVGMTLAVIAVPLITL